MAKKLTPKEIKALSMSGWSCGAGTATRAYRGGVTARISTSGTFSVWVGNTMRGMGTEECAIYAAMEANELAWAQPEYKRSWPTANPLENCA